MAGDNRTLGKFHLVGIPPAPRGMPQVEVTFDIDANGIVNVSAKDMGTGREQKITITASSGLAKDEIDKMMRDAESHAADDAKKREEIEARNRLDGLTYQMEKTVSDNREKVGAVAAEVDTAVAEAKTALRRRTKNSTILQQTAGRISQRARHSTSRPQRRRRCRITGDQARPRVRRPQVAAKIMSSTLNTST